MKIQIDKAKKMPLYKQISEQIRTQITSGEIPDDFQFPSERQLADTLGVNRTTVLNAYKELKAEGLMASHVGRGTVATRGIYDGTNTVNHKKGPMWEYLLSDTLKYNDDFNVNKYLEIANQKNIISFAAGIASFENPPVKAFEGMANELQKNQRELLVSPVAGFFSLRKEMSSYMKKRSCFCSSSEIMILSGAQQGIHLIAWAFINPGDFVIIEEPSFFCAIQIFRSMGAKILAVPLEEDGINIKILEQLLTRYKPKLIYTMPTYHNPCGVTMSIPKRVQLLELANRYAVPVLEDDAYSELNFDEPPCPPLKSMDKNENVIYISTFSKTIYPGLRLGWLCANKKLIHQLSNLRQLMDLHSSCISQYIVERFIASGEMETYLEQIRKAYKERRDIMLQALNEYAPHELSWNTPAGGYYLWCRLPEGVSADILATQVSKSGVAILPGIPSYLSNQKGDDYIRLNYTFPPKNKINGGIKILCDEINKLTGSYKEYEQFSEREVSPIL